MPTFYLSLTLFPVYSWPVSDVSSVIQFFSPHFADSDLYAQLHIGWCTVSLVYMHTYVLSDVYR
jgi:hypothetical protein